MKTLKISDAVHKELKIFSAQFPDSMTHHANAAISEYLRLHGYKFSKQNKQVKK